MRATGHTLQRVPAAGRPILNLCQSGSGRARRPIRRQSSRSNLLHNNKLRSSPLVEHLMLIKAVGRVELSTIHRPWE